MYQVNVIWINSVQSTLSRVDRLEISSFKDFLNFCTRLPFVEHLPFSRHCEKQWHIQSLIFTAILHIFLLLTIGHYSSIFWNPCYSFRNWESEKSKNLSKILGLAYDEARIWIQVRKVRLFSLYPSENVSSGSFRYSRTAVTTLFAPSFLKSKTMEDRIKKKTLPKMANMSLLEC